MHDTTSLLPREDPSRAGVDASESNELKQAEFFTVMLVDTERFEIELVKYLKKTFDRNLSPDSKMAIL